MHTPGNVFERFHLCFHAKTDANTNNLLQKLELIQYIENIFPCFVKTGVKTIKEMKTFLKTLGNDARVHIALVDGLRLKWDGSKRVNQSRNCCHH